MMRSIVLILLASFGSTFCAAWENQADRYAEEYLNHSEAECPIAPDNIKHFVYFSRDRDAIIDHAFLDSERFAGAQIMYSWAELEPNKDDYDFSKIEDDLNYLKQFKKSLFVQLQDATFHPKYKAVPKYLLTPEYAGGAVPQFNDKKKIEGWVAKRWDFKVQLRFAKLLNALGKEFDGRIEGINLQESAIGVTSDTAPDFSSEKYADSLKINMKALKESFPWSAKLQYANFMPGEWLPWEDEGYLKSIYTYGEEIGVGLGAPDLMIRRKAQLNHALAMMHENEYSVPLGIAVQDGNYIGQTGNVVVQKNRNNIVPALHSFAHKFLKVDYMFWVNQKPYFEEDVLPCFKQ